MNSDSGLQNKYQNENYADENNKQNSRSGDQSYRRFCRRSENVFAAAGLNRKDGRRIGEIGLQTRV